MTAVPPFEAVQRRAKPATRRRLSQHFNEYEFRCHHCGLVWVAASLVISLERLRAIVGHPIVLRSGFRCRRHNAAVGGARGSQHLAGRAVDLYLGTATVQQAERAGFTGIGSRGNAAVHVDVRPSGPARWTY